MEIVVEDIPELPNLHGCIVKLCCTEVDTRRACCLVGVNIQEAHRAGMTVEEAAKEQAEKTLAAFLEEQNEPTNCESGAAI